MLYGFQILVQRSALFPPPPKNGIIVITINSGCWKIAASYLPICKAIIPVIAFAKWHFLSNHLIHGNRLKYSIGVFANIVTQQSFIVDLAAYNGKSISKRNGNDYDLFHRYYGPKMNGNRLACKTNRHIQKTLLEQQSSSANAAERP